MTDRWTHDSSLAIPADPGRIFTALTSRAEVEQWFAEHARVDPTPGGSYRFWGRHTIGTPDESGATGRVIAVEPNVRLEFDWTLFGVASRVTLTLTPEENERGRATRVAVRHELEGRIEQPRPEALIDDWWRLAMGNLRAHITGSGDVLRPDFADPRPEIRIVTTIDASRERVFRALTEPAALNRWLAKDATVELRVGGRFDLGWKSADGAPLERTAMEILDLVANEKLTISWPDWRGNTSVQATSVTWLLEPLGNGTKVTLVHSGFVRPVDLSDYPFGWRHFLSEMAKVAASLD